MARISVGGGVSDARALADQPGYIAPAVPEEPLEEAVVEPEAAPQPAAPAPTAPTTPAAVAPVQAEQAEQAPPAPQAPASAPAAAPTGKGGPA
jgi:hypothetical protein